MTTSKPNGEPYAPASAGGLSSNGTENRHKLVHASSTPAERADAESNVYDRLRYRESIATITVRQETSFRHDLHGG